MATCKKCKARLERCEKCLGGGKGLIIGGTCFYCAGSGKQCPTHEERWK